MITILKSKDGQFYFTVTAKNGKKLATSETYKSKQSAVKGAKAVLNAENIVDKTVL